MELLPDFYKAVYTQNFHSLYTIFFFILNHAHSLAASVQHTMDGLYGAPQGFPCHINFLFMILPKHHFRQFIVLHFGATFLWEVEQSPLPLLLPIVRYGPSWTISFYLLV